jgi:hypothetical protein
MLCIRLTFIWRPRCRSVSWVMVDAGSDAGGRATGHVPTAKFFGSEFNKNGRWLDSPEAVRLRANPG